ncbi:uncharacterized protein [Amphiura filiformis]|uniref:uncharacterized protein n=1 Tax=Amphiura filiformis TaxID=82378 RepID=UPI003B213E52
MKRNNPELWEECKKKDAARKREVRAKAKRLQKDNTAQTDEQATNNPAVEEKFKRASLALPKSPRKKAVVLKKLVYDLSPGKKKYVLGSPCAEKRARKLTPGTSGSAATNDDDDSDSDSDTGRNSENGEDSDTAKDDTETSEVEENSDSDRDNDDDDDDDKTENTCRPVCGDFVAVILVGKKQKKLYVAQVTDITPLPEDFEECVQLKYMEAVNNDGMVYRWARDDDYSREPLPSIIAVLDPPTAVQGSATRETFTFNMKAVLEKFKQT